LFKKPHDLPSDISDTSFVKMQRRGYFSLIAYMSNQSIDHLNNAVDDKCIHAFLVKHALLVIKIQTWQVPPAIISTGTANFFTPAEENKLAQEVHAATTLFTNTFGAFGSLLSTQLYEQYSIRCERDRDQRAALSACRLAFKAVQCCEQRYDEDHEFFYNAFLGQKLADILNSQYPGVSTFTQLKTLLQSRIFQLDKIILDSELASNPDFSPGRRTTL
jgi:hypothetical protein